MMLEWLGERRQDAQAHAAARATEVAVTAVLADQAIHTADWGGRAPTAAVGDAVVAVILVAG